MPRPATATHPWPAWFQDSVQHSQLLTNRTLRGYLLAHSAERWPEVVKATLLYGVLCLQRDFPGQPALELAQLHEASRRLHAEAALGAALPAIRSQFATLEANVGGFLAELAGQDENARAQVQAGSEQQTAVAGGGQPGGVPQGKDGRPALSSARSTPIACGSHAATVSHAAAPPRPRPRPPAGVYPDWWPAEGAAQRAASRRSSGCGKPRPQPRLAYSRPPSAPPPVTQDDLPTAAFLLVPPRLDVGAGRGGSAGSSSGTRKGGAAALAQPKVKLAHAQRLLLQRQEHDGGWPDGGSSASAASGVAPPERQGGASAQGTRGVRELEGYDPAAAAKWRQHFGL